MNADSHVLVINGKRYKHITDFERTRNATKQYIWRNKGKKLPVLKLRGGYYIEIDRKGNSKF